MAGQHVFSDAFMEIVSRLTCGQWNGSAIALLVQGGIMDGVTVAPLLAQDQITSEVLPAVWVWPERVGNAIDEEFVGRQAKGMIDITIVLYEDAQYGYCSADKTRGLFPLYERVMDAIHSAIDGSGVDLTGSNHWLNPPDIEIKGFIPMQAPESSIGFGLGIKIYTPIYDKGSLTV